jgi:hypothetical protein
LSFLSAQVEIPNDIIRAMRDRGHHNVAILRFRDPNQRIAREPHRAHTPPARSDTVAIGHWKFLPSIQ